MTKNKPIIITDPYPRTMDILFSKENLKYLKKNFTLIKAPKVNKKKSKQKFACSFNIYLKTILYSSDFSSLVVSTVSAGATSSVFFLLPLRVVFLAFCPLGLYISL